MAEQNPKQKEDLTQDEFTKKFTNLAYDYVFKFKRGSIVGRKEEFLTDPLNKAKFFSESIFILKICCEKSDDLQVIKKIEEILKDFGDLPKKVVDLIHKIKKTRIGKNDYIDELQELFIENDTKINKLFSLIMIILSKRKTGVDYDRTAGYSQAEADEYEE